MSTTTTLLPDPEGPSSKTPSASATPSLLAQALSLSLLKGKSPTSELGDPEAAGASGGGTGGSDGSPQMEPPAGGSTGGSTGGKGGKGKGGNGTRKINNKRKERAAVQTHQGAEDEYASVKSQAHKRHELADSALIQPPTTESTALPASAFTGVGMSHPCLRRTSYFTDMQGNTNGIHGNTN